MAPINTDKKLSFREFPPVSREMWDKVIEKDLKGADYKTELRWNPDNDLEVLPFYRDADHPAAENRPVPGIVSASWEIRQRITSTDLDEANRAALTALEYGATGLYFDLPENTLRSVADLESLFEGIILDIIGVHFGPAISTPALFNLLLSYFDEKGVRPEDLDLSLDFDPISASMISGISGNLTDMSDQMLTTNLFRTLAVNAQYYGNAGASIPDQIALCLAAGNEFMGLSDEPEALASRIHFNLCAGSLYFPEIAKLRSLRILWKQVLDEYQEGLGDKYPAYIHSETASWNKFSVDPHNNMLRSTTEAMSAILGSSDAFTADRYDLGYQEESPFADRVARNIQILLQEESHLDAVQDPAAGSYYIEELTAQISEKAWRRFQEIESHGGMVAAIRKGIVQGWINEARRLKTASFKKEESIRVGVNKYPPEDAKPEPYEGLPLPGAGSEGTKVDTIKLLHLDNFSSEVLK
ncbi:methylmalonyl-CoA mutase family protein [Balneola sp. MJW-20]|uniref:methylmalonyl-CoA mutase family protein n=1 Tax=Gracilimonas aurantiaca TaxID=3234185 RepID=UPI003466B93C